jgi:phosphoribosylformylglycinamidine synthase
MLLVARAGEEKKVEEIFSRWGLDAAVVGRVTAGGRMVVRWYGETVVDIPVDPVAASAPVYDRPVAKPAALAERQRLDLATIAPEDDPEEALEALLDSPNLCDKKWVYRQYDQLVQGNTVLGPGGDAALVRVKREDGVATDKGLAMAVDCNPRWCWLDPYTGTMAAVAEAARNVACTGARPAALTNCLNFGNPEKPEIMWQFKEATRGLAAAARALGTPVISGNVSFYNETSGRPIYPTPTIAVVGILEPWGQHAVSHFPEAGLAVVLLGETREELGGSEWLALRRGIEAGRPPTVDLEAELRLHRLLASAVADGSLLSAHDVSDGGLAVALAECSFTNPDACVGATLVLPEATRMRRDALLFGESTGRVVATTRDAQALLRAADRAGVPACSIGQTGGDRLRIAAPGTSGEGRSEPWIDVAVERLERIWRLGLPRRLEES